MGENPPRFFRWAYFRSWFWLDFLSVLPYNAIGGGNAGFLKMLKCVRLLKLFRVFKQPRIMARIAARNTMRAGQQAVLKYIAILFFLLHWAACAIRMIGFLTLDGCHAMGRRARRPKPARGRGLRGPRPPPPRPGRRGRRRRAPQQGRLLRKRRTRVGSARRKDDSIDISRR